MFKIYRQRLLAIGFFFYPQNKTSDHSQHLSIFNIHYLPSDKKNKKEKKKGGRGKTMQKYTCKENETSFKIFNTILLAEII